MGLSIKKSKRMNYLGYRRKSRRTISLTTLIEKSEARIRKLKKDNAPIAELIDEQEWLNKLLTKESERII